MDRHIFFKQIIDEYLFFDLKNMAKVEQKDGEPAGAASYPMLATCVSSIELLGGLLYKKNYSADNDWVYFEYYWDNYLVKSAPQYTGYGRLFWKLVRNGVAHTYIAKVAISVTKDEDSRVDHLVFHNGNNRFNINCIAFYEDFKRSYDDLVKPKLGSENAFTAQIDKNITAMLAESEELCNDILTPLKPTKPNLLSTTETTTIFPGQIPTVPSGIKASAKSLVIKDPIKFNIPDSTAQASGPSLITKEVLDSLKALDQEDFSK